MTDPASAFDALAGRIAAIEQQFAGLHDDLAELSASGTDESGLVSVTVDAVGELTALTFQPAALRAGTEGLAAMVLDAYRQARTAAIDQLNERTEGLDAKLGASLGELFGQPGDFSALNRLEETMGRLDRLGRRLPGQPA
ncbi:YbaB/EbfC family nucleoid-associated protein [Micromonospora phytophila]|uniref:YbaB/EbfC family nucleoid-associated protein n=1 Tax=Micromonospora phytophila TaxID=709888 RepID=UPI00202E89A3|nr:YbaB/EbfC family nucleoid-associated protein [Micromonospora phytophila]MCM0677937.1 YbaB/EbfC family nucleoid-associated protein [Micromonospora phytophila]